MSAKLEAVVLDLDGTLIDSERHVHRVAFNSAFEEFELPYRWGEQQHGELLRITGGKRRIESYLADQGVAEEERAHLAADLHARKTEIMLELIDKGEVEARPGAQRLLDELGSAGCRLAVATTGSHSWVERVLDQVFGDTPFEALVTGDEVEERKPDPEAFVVALERLGVERAGAVAVEDSNKGLEAAEAAGLPCAIVANGYTLEEDFSAAGVVLDGFGEPDVPAQVLADAAGTGCAGVLDLATLERLVGTR